MLAAGWASWLTAGANWDFLPLFAAIGAVIIVRTSLRMRLTAVNTSVAFACGTLWAWLLEDWGVVPSVSLALLVVIWIGPAVRRRVPPA